MVKRFAQRAHRLLPGRRGEGDVGAGDDVETSHAIRAEPGGGDHPVYASDRDDLAPLERLVALEPPGRLAELLRRSRSQPSRRLQRRNLARKEVRITDTRNPLPSTARRRRRCRRRRRSFSTSPACTGAPASRSPTSSPSSTPRRDGSCTRRRCRTSATSSTTSAGTAAARPATAPTART